MEYITEYWQQFYGGGSYPLWYKPLNAIGSIALLEWRVIWSVLFLLILVLFFKRKSFFDSIPNISWKNITIMSFILSLWWLTYIYGILTNRVLEVAMGYFISPIMSLFVSQFMFKEKINLLQKVAIAIASVSVSVMIFDSFDDNYFPWIALTIGFCFHFMGYLKKELLVIQS